MGLSLFINKGKVIKNAEYDPYNDEFKEKYSTSKIKNHRQSVLDKKFEKLLELDHRSALQFDKNVDANKSSLKSRSTQNFEEIHRLNSTSILDEIQKFKHQKSNKKSKSRRSRIAKIGNF